MIASLRSHLSPYYLRFLKSKEKLLYFPNPILTADQGNAALKKAIMENKPFAAGKVGGTELRSIFYYLYEQKHDPDRWYSVADNLNDLSGVYPTDKAIFEQFCDYYLSILNQVDFMGTWFNIGESQIVKKYAAQSQYMLIRGQEPWYFDNPWTKALEGKTLLAVHPFETTIKNQIKILDKVWQNHPEFLPSDLTVKTLRVPQYAKLVPPQHADWFTALDAMKDQMNNIDYDFAMIGAGAWSLPLAVHAKTQGKMALHLGGASQLFFGIKGDRWVNNVDVNQYWNDDWTHPLPEDTPQQAEKIEGGCYW